MGNADALTILHGWTSVAGGIALIIGSSVLAWIGLAVVGRAPVIVTVLVFLLTLALFQFGFRLIFIA